MCWLSSLLYMLLCVTTVQVQNDWVETTIINPHICVVVVAVHKSNMIQIQLTYLVPLCNQLDSFVLWHVLHFLFYVLSLAFPMFLLFLSLPLKWFTTFIVCCPVYVCSRSQTSFMIFCFFFIMPHHVMPRLADFVSLINSPSFKNASGSHP